MKKRLGDVICIAPWTELDLNRELKMREQKKKKNKMNENKNRQDDWSRRSNND